MNCKLFGSLLLAGTLLPAVARANTYTPLTDRPAWEFTSYGTTLNNGTGYTFGIVFVPQVNLTVTYLGYFYDPTTGMTESHYVGLYNSSGTLLDSTTITSASPYCSPSVFAPVPCPGAPQSPHFLYNPVPEVELFAGQTYVVEGTSGVVDPYNWNENGYAVLWPLTVEGDNWVANGGFTLSFNGTGLKNDVSNGFFGPDMAFAPEPSSLLLLGSGILGLAGYIKRKLAA